MVERKLLGTKTGRGFYKKEGDQILTLDIDYHAVPASNASPSFPRSKWSRTSKAFPNG